MEIPQTDPSEGTPQAVSEWEHPANVPGDEDSRDWLRVEAGTQRCWGRAGIEQRIKKGKKKGKIKSLLFGKMTRTGSSAGKEGRAWRASTAPLPCRGLHSLTGLGGLSTALSTLPAPRACTPGCQGGAAINYPGSYSRRVGEAARIHTPAPGQVQSGPRRRQLTGPRGITRPRGNATALSMLMGVAMATPDQMMGTPAKAIEAGAGVAGGPELSQPHGHHLALGRQGHLGVSP